MTNRWARLKRHGLFQLSVVVNDVFNGKPSMRDLSLEQYIANAETRIADYAEQIDALEGEIDTLRDALSSMKADRDRYKKVYDNLPFWFRRWWAR